MITGNFFKINYTFCFFFFLKLWLLFCQKGYFLIYNEFVVQILTFVRFHGAGEQQNISNVTFVYSPPLHSLKVVRGWINNRVGMPSSSIQPVVYRESRLTTTNGRLDGAILQCEYNNITIIYIYCAHCSTGRFLLRAIFICNGEQRGYPLWCGGGAAERKSHGYNIIIVVVVARQERENEYVIYRRNERVSSRPEEFYTQIWNRLVYLYSYQRAGFYPNKG